MAKRDQAQAYIEHLRRDTFPQLRAIAGFIDVTILRMSVDRGVEFVVVTQWENLAAIRGFAGDEVVRG